MRELKFRAWDGKKMIEDVVPASESSIIEVYEYEHQYVEVEAVEQYTGLKDKNGKEIYEGDIVRIGRYLFDTTTAVVKQHKDGSWLVIDRSGKADMPYSLYYHPESVVIGNIHENADLLEEKK